MLGTCRQDFARLFGRQVARCADGVVVGSALVNVIRDNLANRAGLPARLRITAADLVAGVASSSADR